MKKIVLLRRQPVRKISSSRKHLKIPPMQEEIRRRAAISLALLGMAFVRRGSGQFLNIR